MWVCVGVFACVRERESGIHSLFNLNTHSENYWDGSHRGICTYSTVKPQTHKELVYCRWCSQGRGARFTICWSSSSRITSANPRAHINTHICTQYKSYHYRDDACPRRAVQPDGFTTSERNKLRSLPAAPTVIGILSIINMKRLRREGEERRNYYFRDYY